MRTCRECERFDECRSEWVVWWDTEFDPERAAPEDCFESKEPTENTEGGR